MKKNKKATHIAVRSEEVQEILSYIPHWMIRWGMTLVFIIVLLLIFISWFVKYPDIISSEVIVTTTLPPEKVISRSNGQMDALLVKDAEFVEEHTLLAVVKNSAKYKDVLLLKKFTDKVVLNATSFYFPLHELPVLMLGDIATSFAVFENNYSKYVLNKKLKPFNNESAINRLSISQTKQRLEILIVQKDINKRELALKEKGLSRQQLLFDKGIISAQDYELKQLGFLQAKKNAQGMNSQISQLKESLGNLYKSLNGTWINKRFEETTQFNNVIQSFYQLKKAIKDWEYNYALISSISGQVAFVDIWNKTQTIKSGDIVFSIVPNEFGSYIGKIKAASYNFGKIKIGQKVHIKLQNYPSNEYGMLIGIINRISIIPDAEGFYNIDVNLDTTLITTYNKKISFNQEMRGMAEIITEDLRLMERFFYQLKNVINRS